MKMESSSVASEERSAPNDFLDQKMPSLYHSKVWDVSINLHVDDGDSTGPDAELDKTYEYLEKHIELKKSKKIWPGMSYDILGVTKFYTKDAIISKPHDKYIEESLKILKMENCNPSTSPKLDRSNMEGDDNLCEKAANYRTVVCKLIYLSKRRPDIKSTVRWLCKKLKDPTQKHWR